MCVHLHVEQVKKRVGADDCRRNGWILDGFPRTLRQASLMQARIACSTPICLACMHDTLTLFNSFHENISLR